MKYKHYFWVLFSTLLATLSFSVSAEFQSGSQLKAYLEKWENKEAGFEGGYGAGYVIGVADSRRGVNFCPPSSVTVGQLTAMVLKQLRDNPDKLHFSGDAHVIHVLQKTWPCPDRQRGTEGTPNPSVQRPVPKAKPKDQDTSPF